MSTYKEWAQENRNDPAVKAWIRENPPHKHWVGTKLEWAYLNMPDRGKIGTAGLMALGLAALGAGVAALRFVTRSKVPDIRGPIG